MYERDDLLERMREHDRLLEKWSRGRRRFICDGIVNLKCWESTEPKVLLLLKEAYGSGYSDLRIRVRETQPTGTWRKSAYWCYAIHHIKRGRLPGLPFLPDREAEYNKAVEALRSSAIVNIKKSNGRNISPDHVIRKYAQHCKPLIQRQIELIKPDIVICGGTWRFVKNWWPERVELYDGVNQVGHHVFVDFWHPAYRISEELKYYALAGLLHFSKALAGRVAAAAA